MSNAKDTALLEQSLLALGDAYDGIAAELFQNFIAAHPQYTKAFANPEAAQERMTRETLEAMLGYASGEWWVASTVTNFVDLHRDYDRFKPDDYRDWFTLVIETMAIRAGDAWPADANLAWQRQADGLMQMVTAELS
ncbi:hypothetical protein [Parasphingorhabdus sp.]|jgi:hypothetical protein|uniref:hypothetical protein n=1 Tax=Parasphingorhabdus sp. TaxID=2709688 RepID=UPI003D2756F0